MSHDITERECPEHCPHRPGRHVHLEAADGCAQVWGADEQGGATLLDPFDLTRTAKAIYPARPRGHRRRR